MAHAIESDEPVAYRNRPHRSAAGMDSGTVTNLRGDDRRMEDVVSAIVRVGRRAGRRPRSCRSRGRAADNYGEGASPSITSVIQQLTLAGGRLSPNSSGLAIFGREG